TAQRAAVSVGEAEAQRANARTPFGAEEAQSLFRRAEHAALAGARRRDAAEFPTPTALCPLDVAITAVEVDGRRMVNFAGVSGARLRLSLAAAFAPQPGIEQVDQLAERLDLEMGGLLLAPFALGGALAQ